MKKIEQKGQALIILLLIMLVTLTIGLAVTQRSLSDLSSSNKVDQSTRAFSAAEAGIEKALQSGSSTVISSGELQDQATANVKISDLLPLAHQALEYPPIGKDTVAQFWLADPTSLATVYPGNTPINIYFGNRYDSSPQNPDIPAIEVNLISKSGGNYVSTKYFYDPVTSRQASDNFTCNSSFPPACAATPSCQGATHDVNTSNSPNKSSGPDRHFWCMITINTPASPIMIRARILYSNTDQPIAVEPVGSSNSLPPQARIYTSIGTAGQTLKKIQVFKMQYVVPAYFDFAIFSAGDITK